MLTSQNRSIVYNSGQIVYIEIRMTKIVVGLSNGADYIVGMYSSKEAAEIAFHDIIDNLRSGNTFVEAMSDERACQLADHK